MNTDRFKFRVWDKKDKQYLAPDYYEEFAITQDGVIHVGLTVENGICDEFQSFRPESLIVEQCTGIQDKNGKLIFEGDVLRATCTDGKHIDYPVGWWDGAFHLYYVDKSLIAETGTIQFCLRGLVSIKNCCYREIIGNIHEDQFHGKDGE